MNPELKTVGRKLGAVVLAAGMLLSGSSVALANGKPVVPAAPALKIKDERALALLKGMSDTLAKAQTLSFKVRGLVPIAAPTGQFVNLITSSQVVMQRPDKLFVESRGDLFPSDIYYDGKTVTAVAFDENFYAQREAANTTLDAIIQNANPGSEALAPFVEMLASDPYAVLTQGMTSAMLVGQSMVGGVMTEHLAFVADGIDWEIWIGTADKLPRLMVVSYRDGERQPTFTAEFSDWMLGITVPTRRFDPAIPKDAVKIEFKLHGLLQSK